MAAVGSGIPLKTWKDTHIPPFIQLGGSASYPQRSKHDVRGKADTSLPTAIVYDRRERIKPPLSWANVHPCSTGAAFTLNVPDHLVARRPGRPVLSNKHSVAPQNPRLRSNLTFGPILEKLVPRPSTILPNLIKEAWPFLGQLFSCDGCSFGQRRVVNPVLGQADGG